MTFCRFSKGLRVLAFSSIAWTMTAPVFSQPPPAPTGADASQRADELFQKGKALYKAGKMREAYAAYKSAWELKQSYDIAANVANSELQLGMARDAAEHFAFCMKNFPATGNKAQLEEVKKRFAVAREQVGALTIQVNVAGAEVLVDGVAVGRSPIADEVFADPGTRTVEAKLSGYAPAKQSVTVTKGPAQTLSLSLTALEVAAPAASASASASGGPPNPPATGRGPGVGWIIATGVLAVGGIGAGAGLTAAANGKSGEVDALGKTVGGPAGCSGAAAPSACASLRSAAESRDTLSNAALATFVVGGTFALATAGLGIWAVMAGKPAASVQVAPVVTGREGGIVVVGTW